MTRRSTLIVALCLLVASVSSASAHHRRHHHHHSHIAMHFTDANGNYDDPRPHAWCGWWMRHYLGVRDRAFNLARKWAQFGSPSGGPAVGVIAVWPHHVAIITGRGPDGWIMKSGNDGHAVRERERSLRGAIAFRWPTGVAMR